MTTETKTPEQQHSEQVKMLQVFTTEQKAAEGQETVIARTRSTEKNPVIEANRLRCIIVPEYKVEGVPSKFHALCLQAVRDIAQKQLDTLWKATPSIKEVPAAIWSLDSVLLFAAREQESKRLTSDNLATWFAASGIAQRIGDNEEKMADWAGRIAKFAAPTPNLSLSACEAVISAIQVADADEDNLIGRQILAKATKRYEEMAAALQEKVDAV